jgi:hypothetical protein
MLCKWLICRFYIVCSCNLPPQTPGAANAAAATSSSVKGKSNSCVFAPERHAAMLACAVYSRGAQQPYKSSSVSLRTCRRMREGVASLLLLLQQRAAPVTAAAHQQTHVHSASVDNCLLMQYCFCCIRVHCLEALEYCCTIGCRCVCVWWLADG